LDLTNTQYIELKWCSTVLVSRIQNFQLSHQKQYSKAIKTNFLDQVQIKLTLFTLNVQTLLIIATVLMAEALSLCHTSY